MALVKDRVIVIKGSDFSEADKIITLFGRNRGKFSVIAKGVRKFESRNRAATQTLSIAEISYYEGQNLGVLVEADLIHSPFLDHQMLKNSAKITYLVNKLFPEDDKEEKIYNNIENIFINDRFDIRSINQARLKILGDLGYIPDPNYCAICKKRCKIAGVDLQDFTIICEECYKNDSNHASFTSVNLIRYESELMDKALDRLVSTLAGSN